jgi:hypothetical protein
VQEFAIHFPRNLSSLEVPIVCQITRQDLEILKVRRAKLARALCWLKENNRYYKDMIIIIDNEFLQSLPVDGSIDDQNTQIVAEDLDHDEEDVVITRTFVPVT